MYTHAHEGTPARMQKDSFFAGFHANVSHYLRHVSCRVFTCTCVYVCITRKINCGQHNKQEPLQKDFQKKKRTRKG
jgi:hypothetical protein